jgi:UrcA family protein
MIAALIGACSTLALGGSALAGGFGEENPIAHIKYTRADLSTSDGAKSLALRIRIAADEVCGAREDVRVRETDAFWRCRDATVDSALRSLDAPLVATALGRSPEVLARASH